MVELAEAIRAAVARPRRVPQGVRVHNDECEKPTVELSGRLDN